MLRGPATAVAGLARRFAAEGHELALVGGPVRDVFLGRRHGDLDLATGARPGEVRTIAAGWAGTIWDTGIEFGTVGLRRGSLVCEITTYRSEQYRPESRKPAQVAYGRSLEADLARRDFTVNAVAARLPSLEIVDPTGGVGDLKARVLRTPGPPEDSFGDDALRMLRAAVAVVSDVCGLVALHLRFHGYGQAEWTDAAVRRYVRDAGPLLTRLHVLTRADCTTRNKAKALRLQRAYDDLEQRITTLSAQEELDKIRPDLNGTQIMEVLGIPPGPLVGQAKRFLLELRMEHGPLGRDRAGQELLRWAEAKGLDVPAPSATPPAGG